MKSLKNKIAIVSGGSSGIGLAVTNGLAELGVFVELFDIRQPQGKLKYENVSFSQVDLSEASAVDEAVSSLQSRHQRIDYLVNCAGICLFEQDGSILETSISVFERTLRVNLYGTMHLLRSIVPMMKRSENAAMVHVASVVGLRNMENIKNGGPCDAYQISKAAIVSLSRSLAVQLAVHGIRSNTVCPGSVMSSMTEEIYRQPGRLDAMKERTPLGRIGRPEEIADAVIFLLSERASFITGVDLPVDGGILAKL